MAHGVTFQVLDGIDKGRVFRDLPVPVTIGREEGNILRLNDERVSRYHAKVQTDSDDFILTDLESTNGTKVNGNIVQIRRLRYGDRVSVGRSLLLFGSNEEIAARMASLASAASSPSVSSLSNEEPNDGLTIQTTSMVGDAGNSLDFEVDVDGKMNLTRDALFIGNRALPPMPLKLTPSQAARFAEILDFLHQGLTDATENILAKDDGSQVTLEYADWQKVVAVQMLLARYLRLVAEPPELDE
ncbi:MAG: FHA domain-containing protein [Gemmataceae bacterium]|nr:FHA domain-containing protein [Gemmataceae bacterium]